MALDLATELGRLLAQLDKPPDEVAALLKDAGVSGVRNTVRFLNPIVRFVQAQFRLDDFALDVMKPHVMRLKLPDGSAREVSLPRGASDFLVAFDRGQYPDLEDYTRR